MYVWHVFLVRPFAVISIVVCLATVYWCWAVLRRRAHHSLDRLLIGFMGLLTVYQGLRILRGFGLLTLPTQIVLDDAIEFLVTAFYLLAVLILRLSSENRTHSDFQLRLAKAAAANSNQSSPPAPSESSPMDARIAIRDTLAWALPQLSDGAFKLYAYLCLNADHTTGMIAVNGHDLLLQTGRTEKDVAAYLTEFQKVGARVVFKGNNVTEVEISGVVNRSALRRAVELKTA